MIETVPVDRPRLTSHTDAVLKRSAEAWFVTAVVGQWIFVYYLLAYYVRPALLRGVKAWSDNALSTGYIPGDMLGNAAVATHIFLAILIIGGGQLQLIPQIRSRFPTFHRWNGRIYMGAVATTSLAGFYMVWVRGNPQAGAVENIGISLGGVLIIVFALTALRHARAWDTATHRRWALRLFMVVSGVWFIRLGYGLWYFFLDGAPASFKAFSVFISYAQYVIPLAVLELYLRTQDRAGSRGRFAVAALLFALTVLTGIGIFQATMNLWLPRL